MKFKIVEAGRLPKNTTVIARIDEESMHGNAYMAVNADKPYAGVVAALIQSHHGDADLPVKVKNLEFVDVSRYERKAFSLIPTKILEMEYKEKSSKGFFEAKIEELESGSHRLELDIVMLFKDSAMAKKFATAAYALMESGYALKNMKDGDQEA